MGMSGRAKTGYPLDTAQNLELNAHFLKRVAIPLTKMKVGCPVLCDCHIITQVALCLWWGGIYVHTIPCKKRPGVFYRGANWGSKTPKNLPEITGHFKDRVADFWILLDGVAFQKTWLPPGSK